MTNYCILTLKNGSTVYFLFLNCMHNYNFKCISFVSVLLSAFLAILKALEKDGTRSTLTKKFRLCLSESSRNFIITRDHVNFSKKEHRGRSPHDEEKL